MLGDGEGGRRCIRYTIVAFEHRVVMDEPRRNVGPQTDRPAFSPYGPTRRKPISGTELVVCDIDHIRRRLKVDRIEAAGLRETAAVDPAVGDRDICERPGAPEDAVGPEPEDHAVRDLQFTGRCR